jgi:ketosteroid isomerase-like protein
MRSMHTLAFVAALLSVPVLTMAQTSNDGNLAQRIQQLEDRAALKMLVDTFSNLADRKDVQRQVLLFTEDASVESITDGKPSTPLKGREQIGKAFAAYLANFDTVYHINGQQTVDVRGDTAMGTVYCLVVLIGTENGRRIKNTSGVTYNDEYARRGNTWLISKRVSHFTWRDREEMAQPQR